MTYCSSTIVSIGLRAYSSEDFLRNIHGVASVAELDGDELGYLVGKDTEIKRQR